MAGYTIPKQLRATVHQQVADIQSMQRVSDCQAGIKRHEDSIERLRWMASANSAASLLLVTAGSLVATKKPTLRGWVYAPAIVMGLLYMPIDDKITAARRANHMRIAEYRSDYEMWVRLRQRWAAWRPPQPKPDTVKEYSDAVTAQRASVFPTYPM